jgi:hypothetical protein
MRLGAWIGWILAASGMVACANDDPGGGWPGGAGYPGLVPPGADNGDDGGWPPKASNAGDAASSLAPPASPSGRLDASAPSPGNPNDPIDPGTPVANPQNAFSDAGAYEASLPALNANAMHAAPVTGQPCLRCHDGSTDAAEFAFAGTVWQWPALTIGAPEVEIRQIDANSVAHLVHSDADGNFWDRSDAPLAMPSLSGVRTGTFQAIGELNGTSCNECHNEDNSTPGRLFVQ